MTKVTMEQVTLEGGQVLNAHSRKDCRFPKRCTIHKPSNHNMRSFPQSFRGDRYLMERICPHGVGHPDPDHIYYVQKTLGNKVALTDSVHGCDGCCSIPATETTSKRKFALDD